MLRREHCNNAAILTLDVSHLLLIALFSHDASLDFKMLHFTDCHPESDELL